MEDNVRSMQKPELRSYLSARGITVGDYRVDQLRELALKASEMKLPVIQTQDDSTEQLQRRTTVYIDGETVQHAPICDQILKNWTDDLSVIPAILSSDIFAHLIGNANWSSDRIRLYKKERGYLLFLSHHIGNVQCHSLSHEHMYVRALCTRETSQSEKPYLVWCLLSNEGSIFSAGCECTGDDGGCKHVVALLFSVSDWCERHSDRNTETCTDMKCVWDYPRQTSKPMKIDEIIMSEKNSHLIQPFVRNFSPLTSNDNDDHDLEIAVLNLVKDHDTQIIEVLDKDCNMTHEPPTMRSLALLYKTDRSNLTFLDFIKKNVSEKDCTEIETLTEGQSENVNWYKYRLGRITASSVFEVFRYLGNDMNNYVVKKIMSEVSNLSTPAILYGREREPLAREIFQKENKDEHQGYKVNVPGLIVNAAFPYLAASPDGIVSCSCCGRCLIEIKCSYKYKNSTVDFISSENYHIYLDSMGQMKLKQTSPWFYQIQCQLAVSELKYCFFVLYLEGSGSLRHKIYVDKVEFYKEFWGKCLEKIKRFYEKFVVPNLLSD